MVFKDEPRTALQYLKQAIEITDQNPDSFFHASNAYILLKEYEEALEMINKALEIDPFDPRALTNKAGILNSLGKPEESLIFSVQSTVLDNQDHLAWANAGYAHEALGQLELAGKAFTQALAIHPEDPIYKEKVQFYKYREKMVDPSEREKDEILNPHRQEREAFESIQSHFRAQGNTPSKIEPTKKTTEKTKSPASPPKKVLPQKPEDLQEDLQEELEDDLDDLDDYDLDSPRRGK